MKTLDRAASEEADGASSSQTVADLDDLQVAVRAQLGTGSPGTVDVPPDSLVRFAPDLPRHLEPDARAALAGRAEKIGPVLQGPFLLGGDLAVGGVWRSDLRWSLLGPEMAADLSGKDVLDVGSNAGYDAFMFRLRGASRVLACEPSVFIHQARFLESVYHSGIEIEPISWQQLDPERHGRFDLIHCNGVLYHDCHPMAMLQSLRAVLADGGELLLGSMMLADPELSEVIRFVPGSYWGDPTWWMVPGRLATRWMIEAAGFKVVDEFGLAEGPPGEFPVVTAYLRALSAEPPPHATRTRG